MNQQKIAKLITQVELNIKGTREKLVQLAKSPKYSKIIGFTGPLGVGKSSVISKLVQLYPDKKVGLILNDPSSICGGSILGDRVRMQELSDMKNVFIRSVCNQKSLGGFARITQDIITIFNDAQYDIIIVESTGTGQSEIELSYFVDVCVVVLMPGLGDEIQALKSGMNEIADIFVINKSDKQGADRTYNELNSILSMKNKETKIVNTIANKNQGIEELKQAIESIDRKKTKTKEKLQSLLRAEIIDLVFKNSKMNSMIETEIKKIENDETTIYSSEKRILDLIKNGL